MSKKMLIDAAHAEEVRVCVLDNRKVEDFDFESSSRKPLRGNIYLARVTRVEPSLQAAFVEYGGNRHGFLAFNEIHPDYYQIPVSDRRALQEAEAEEAALAAELNLVQRGDDEDDADDADDAPGGDDDVALDAELEAAAAADEDEDDDEFVELTADDDGEDEDAGNAVNGAPTNGVETFDAVPLQGAAFPFVSEAPDEEAAEAEDAVPQDPSVGGPEDRRDAEERKARRSALMERYKEARRKRANLIRNYKIQEVIKRRQILLVQVVKEERGNKGAALTTYLSLAGRYCVLMPNTARGGGISRKIPSASDRKRLRRVVNDLDVAQGMGLIIRTAGAKRTKVEIKRDFDYLTRLWENIRTLTLESIAPCLIYEEASLIKRAIRDLYDKDIGKVLVEGEEGYREAKDFMKMLMPSHAKNVQPYKERTPLFVRHDVENQLDAMYQPVVRLKSGGYLVINQTEALIAVDVNSGKATRERNIELTALKTNLEAAVETARQCRLRDLAGLIVIDFIDMEENKNNRAVEKKLKEALKQDRARIQVGRISSFGLLEMSRQRRRSGIVDGTTHACPTCNGAGAVRSNEMAALRILRAVESEAIAGRAGVVTVKASMDVTLYVLNHKRAWLRRIEDDYALSIEVLADESKAGDQYEIEKHGEPRARPEEPEVVRADMGEAAPGEDAADEADAERERGDEDETALADDGDEDRSSRRRRRRRRKRRDDEALEPADQANASDQGASDDAAASEGTEIGDGGEEQREAAGDDESGERKKRRRRGRRGGRRKARRSGEDAGDAAAGSASGEDQSSEAATGAAGATDQKATRGDAPARRDADAGSDETEDAPADGGETAREQSPGSMSAPVSEEPVSEEPVSPPPANGGDGAEQAAQPPVEASAAGAPDAPSPETQGETEQAVEGEEQPQAPAEAAPSPEEVAERVKKRKSGRKGWWSRALGGL